ncbi:MAG TPA: hypothetical protein VN720_06895 [Rudaea sp.]|nr:hypothetical protein [Rudaea sp.]
MSRSNLADAERAEQVSAHRFAGIVLFTLQPLPAFDPSPDCCLPRLKLAVNNLCWYRYF